MTNRTARDQRPSQGLWRALSLALALVALSLSSGCVGIYYGGPDDDEEPHALVRPGVDITIWKVDGQPTTRHSFEVMVAPGRRKVTVRIEHSMESESPTPYERQTLIIDCKDGMTYHLERKPGEMAPYVVDISEAPFR